MQVFINKTLREAYWVLVNVNQKGSEYTKLKSIFNNWKYESYFNSNKMSNITHIRLLYILQYIIFCDSNLLIKMSVHIL